MEGFNHFQYSVPSPVYRTLLSGINVVPHKSLNETALGLSAAQIRSPQKLTWHWHHVGRP